MNFKSRFWLLMATIMLLGSNLNALDFFQDNIPAVEKESNVEGSIQVLNVIKSQMEAIRAKDIAKAYNIDTSQDFRKATTLFDFKNLVEKFSVLSNNSIVNLDMITISEGFATVTGTITSTSEETLSIEFDLTKENGSWKVMGVQLFKNN